jgi:16S rRNA (uracil1498-N3)-methyltransferase
MSDSAWTGRHRFFISPEAIADAVVYFNREQSHQLARVLRVTEKEPIVVLAGDRYERLVTLTTIDRRATIGRIVDQRPASSAPRLAVSLYQAMLPRERFELALSKATEVGISRFIPLDTERVIARLSERDWPAREARLVSIAREASEQSERPDVATIGSPMAFPEAVRQACSDGPTLIAWERGQANLGQAELRVLTRDNSGVISIFVGPEGGFTSDEITLAESVGASPVWLGPRILRAETAGVVLASILLYQSGDLGFSM